MTDNRGHWPVRRRIRRRGTMTPQDPCARLLLLLLAVLLPGLAAAAVQVIVGPTPIPDGEARAAGDITVMNAHLAFALAVDTAVPYGIPRGALIDAAPIVNGKIGRDHIVFADFIPNDWSAWPNTYHHVEILERSPARAVIRITRDWGQATITTLYTLSSEADAVEIRTTMHNEGSTPLMNLLSGLTLWPKGGYLFSVPGLAELKKGRAEGALSDRVVAYDEEWSIALHAPYLDHVDFDSKDLYRLHTLAPGESHVFEAWLQIGASGDLGAIVQAEIARRHLPSGTVQGSVKTRTGVVVEAPVVVIERQGKAYAWVIGHHGHYQMTLPAGDYALYATARNYSQSERLPIKVAAGESQQQNFLDLAPPGRVHFEIRDTHSGKPLDARLSVIAGQQPLVEFLGRKTLFTELDHKGQLDTDMPPGHYQLKVSAGGGFLAADRTVPLDVASGHTQSLAVTIAPMFDPPAHGWYAADLHHHADQAEAVTPPADLARSQLAAGLDLLFVSDHDSTVNHHVLQKIADERHMAFIPSVELSPSWGHFNAYPLTPGMPLNIDTSTANIDQVFAEARRLGASVIQANHPFNAYGYFSSLAHNEVPGGFNPAFELLEINAAEPGDDDKVLRALWALWNAGHRYYLGAGTDTHDVWQNESGAVRTLAHIEGQVTAQAFADAVSAGHVYVSAGPMLYPNVMFGSQLKLRQDEPFSLSFDLESVTGLKQADLVWQGEIIQSQAFPGAPHSKHIDFALTGAGPSWYQLIVEDALGRKAYADPIWVDVVDAPTPPSTAPGRAQSP
jgi:hypothetical protein